ncbi:MAG: dihydrofolate reductase [Patescibacteria group bacterium]
MLTETPLPPLVIVAGMGKKDRAIGNKNQLLWHVPADLKRFKELSMGHPVIMGRKTFESIFAMIGKPLPGRTNIVVTRDHHYQQDGVKIAHSLAEAIAIAQSEHPSEIHIGGGGEMYQQALPMVSKLFITWFYDNKDGDSFFPDFEDDFETIAEHPPQEHEGIKFQWIDYKRKAERHY